MLIPGLAGGRNSISLKRLQTAQSAEVRASGCGTVSDEFCDVCIQFAVEAIDILLNIILGECRKLMAHVPRFNRSLFVKQKS